jgi:hypothetical protein
LDFNNTYAPDDVTIFANVLSSNNSQFNPAADLDGDGRIQENDLLLLGPRYTAVNASAPTKQSYNNLLINPTLGATRTVTTLLDNSAGSALTKTSDGQVNINGPQSHGPGASISISGGTMNFNTDAGSAMAANLRLIVSGSSIASFGSTQHLAQLTLSGSAEAFLNGPLLDAEGLQITNNGNLDLGHADMVLRPASADAQSSLAAISALIRQARADGFWTGRGVFSSVAAADTQHLTTLGIILNNNGLDQPIYSTFAGQPVDANSILIRYTYTGDLDLDLDIDADDYARIDAGFANRASRYQDGDIDLEGKITSDDFFLMDRAFSNQGGILSTLHTTAIPEPSTLVLLAMLLVLSVAGVLRP